MLHPVMYIHLRSGHCIVDGLKAVQPLKRITEPFEGAETLSSESYSNCGGFAAHRSSFFYEE